MTAIGAFLTPREALPPRLLRLRATAGAALALAEQGFVVCALLILSNAITPLFYASWGLVSNDASVDPLTQLLLFPTYAIAAAIAVWRPGQLLRVAAASPSLWVVLAIVGLSFLWSNVPELTLRRAVALFATTFFAVYLVARFPAPALLRLVAWTFGVAVVLSYVFALVPPYAGMATFPHIGAWRGVYGHKNMLGANMVHATLVLLLVRPRGRSGRVLTSLGAAGAVGLIVLSQSMTSLVVLLAALGLLLLFRQLRLRLDLLVPLVLMVTATGGALVLALALNLERIVRLLGKDLTLTGRTELWPPLIEMIQERLWLGYGFAAFWRGWVGESARLWGFLGWTPKTAHNGLLELLLIFGVVGTVAYLVNLASAYAGGVARIRRSRSAEAFWPLAFLSVLLMQNVTESVVIAQHNLLWVLYAVVVLSVSHERATARRER